MELNVEMLLNTLARIYEEKENVKIRVFIEKSIRRDENGF